LPKQGEDEGGRKVIETRELTRIEADTFGASIESSAQFVPLAFTNIYRSERRRSSGRQIARTREGGTPHSDNNRQESAAGETESLSSQDPSSFYPHARSLADLVTSRQLGIISVLGKKAGLDIDWECDRVLGCKPLDLSKGAASAFIDHLERRQIEQIRRAS
jgi:hypothetical protein